MNIVITGINGFIGSALSEHLRGCGHEVIGITRQTTHERAMELIACADVVFHLAANAVATGSTEEYQDDIEFAESIAQTMRRSEASQLLIVSSSIAALGEGRFKDAPYSIAKKNIEDILLGISDAPGKRVTIYRLTNVFGRKHPKKAGTAVYNFCQNAVDGKPLTISDPSAELELLFIDDVVNEFASAVESEEAPQGFGSIEPSFPITLGELAQKISSFAENGQSAVSSPLDKRLYEAFISYK